MTSKIYCLTYINGGKLLTNYVHNWIQIHYNHFMNETEGTTVKQDITRPIVSGLGQLTLDEEKMKLGGKVIMTRLILC